jgi:hypothetical protein
MTTSPTADQASLDIPTEIWVAGIDPDQPFFRKLNDDRQLVRKDPEALVIPGDQPLVRSGSPNDFVLTESKKVSSTGEVIAVGSSNAAPAGGRNAVLVFALPPLEPGMAITEADFGVQVLGKTSAGNMAADLWALSIAASLDPSQAYLEADQDPNTSPSLVKIADNLLTDATATGSRVTLGEPQRLVLADYIMAFYKDNPDYTGGYNLYLRLNPDIDGGRVTQGWSVAASDHSSQPGPTLTLKSSQSQAVPAANQDFSLTESLQEVTDAGNLLVGSAARPVLGTGRNAILAFDLPLLPAGARVQSASLSFVVASNTVAQGVNGDLWALAIQPTLDSLPKNYLESNSDPDNLHVKISDNILTVSTTVNERVTLTASEADALGEYVANFYAQISEYAGDHTLYLRLNPDVDTGSENTGWRIYSQESPQFVQPVLQLSITSPEKVWVYISIGGDMHRLKTGL